MSVDFRFSIVEEKQKNRCEDEEHRRGERIELFLLQRKK